MLVSEVMSCQVISMSTDEPCTRAARLISRYNIGAVPVCGENGRLRGIVTDRDIVLRCVASENDPDLTPVKEIMSRCVLSVSPESSVTEAADIMSKGQIRRLPVVSKGKLVGVISLSDISRCPECSSAASDAFAKISSNVHRL